MLKRVLISSLFLLGIVTGCQKSSTTTNTGVPNVAVNFSIDINNPQYVNLTVPTGWMYVTGGYHGIIIYRVSQDQFNAYDRTCTYNNAGIVQVEKSSLIAIDSSCGSTFTLLSGAAQHGPATLPLKQYQTSFDGTTLTVSN
jgi:nitrite reductase/ring-hydroxylating ferredoxin subunit